MGRLRDAQRDFYFDWNFFRRLFVLAPLLYPRIEWAALATGAALGTSIGRPSLSISYRMSRPQPRFTALHVSRRHTEGAFCSLWGSKVHKVTVETFQEGGSPSKLRRSVVEEFVNYYTGLLIGKFYSALLNSNEARFYELFWHGSLMYLGQSAVDLVLMNIFFSSLPLWHFFHGLFTSPGDATWSQPFMRDTSPIGTTSN